MPEHPTAASGDVVQSGTIYADGTYLDHNKSWHVEDSAWKAGKIVTMLSRHGLVPESVCEVGCGAGEILRQLSLVYPHTRFVGYELSPQAFELCRSRESANVHYENADLLSQSVHYDCLLCIDVFEHVEDYLGFIRSLKPKASYTVFHIPLDMSIASLLRSNMLHARKSVGHLHYFSRDTALATLTDCGYEIIDSFYTPSAFEAPGFGWRQKFYQLRYRCLFAMSQHFTVKLYGGSSLLVLAK
jgi:hypothetical protein